MSEPNRPEPLWTKFPKWLLLLLSPFLKFYYDKKVAVPINKLKKAILLTDVQLRILERRIKRLPDNMIKNNKLDQLMDTAKAQYDIVLNRSEQQINFYKEKDYTSVLGHTALISNALNDLSHTIHTIENNVRLYETLLN